MQYRNLGSSGLKISCLCLGGMTFGEANEQSFMYKVGSSEKTSFEILDAAVASGINFVDTADVYGQNGLSERVLGSWMADRKKRDQIVLATKFRFTMGDGPNRSGASRYRIVKCVEDSLRRLGTDHIDLYQIHMQDVTAPEEETLRALDDLVHAGKVLYLGCSNYTAYRLVDSLWIAKTEHLNRFVSLQAEYSLITRELEREHVPLCKQHGLGILPWSPLAGGFLSGKYKRNQNPPSGSRMAEWRHRYENFNNERNWKILSALEHASSELNVSCAQIALAWLLSKNYVSSVIFGAKTLDQLNDNLLAADLQLPSEVATKLDEASVFSLGYPYEFMAQVQGRW